MLARRRLCAHGIALRRFHDVRTYKEDKRWLGWQVVVGIETHAQIKSRRKLFSGPSPLRKSGILLNNSQNPALSRPTTSRTLMSLSSTHRFLGRFLYALPLISGVY